MEYRLAIENAPPSITGGSGILLLHPSTGKTDQIDTDFLKTDTDSFLIISTRTTAREVKQKLDHYGVDESNAFILDTLSVERGYSRRSAENIYYVSSPDDLDGIVMKIEQFLIETTGKRRISVDSITELAYYGSEDQALQATKTIHELLKRHDSVGLFHLSPEVHDPSVVEEYESLFDGVIEIGEDGIVSARFDTT